MVQSSEPPSSPWGAPPTVQAPRSQKLSFAQIMKEQTKDKAANDESERNDEALKNMEAEQERMLRMFEENKRRSESQTEMNPEESDFQQTGRNHQSGTVHPSDDDALEMVLRLSLEEFKSTNHSVADGMGEESSSLADPAGGVCESLNTGDENFSRRTLQEIERAESVVNNPASDKEEQRHRSSNSPLPSDSLTSTTSRSLADGRNAMMEEAKKHLSTRELEEIEQALREADDSANPVVNQQQGKHELTNRNLEPQNHFEPAGTVNAEDGFISADEAAAIEAALKEADAKAEEESLMLALQIQQQEINHLARQKQEASRIAGRNPQGNVRSMTRAELDFESQRVSEAYADNSRTLIGADSFNGSVPLHPIEIRQLEEQGVLPRGMGAAISARPHGDYDDFEDEDVGFRMNAASSQQWTRLDRNTIIGPNNEIRTKHDVHVQGQANAHYLGIDADDFGLRTHVGNKAFNSFKRTMKQTKKGVVTHGTGRAGTDSDGAKGKAMDPNARLQISRAINAGLIETCNGAVKQGKEAIVYHAVKGTDSNGHDVAVKIFKRMTEFRGRGDYVDGDPRYVGKNFRKASEREQLEMWAEKEFRNLIRANRAKVPVPTPIQYKDNIIFMRFMGNNGWPAPQIRELDMRKGSKKWDVLYSQVMEAVRRLYVGGRLVHGDLSEYNILIAPAFQVDHVIKTAEASINDLQTVLIDFGQAVDIRHPEANELLRRDLDRVRTFFEKQGVKTLKLEDAIEFIVNDYENAASDEESSSNCTIPEEEPAPEEGSIPASR